MQLNFAKNWLIAIVLGALATGCITESVFDGGYEHVGLTNKQFKEILPHAFGYAGASCIDIKFRSTRDSSDCWERVTISPQAFSGLLAAYDKHQQANGWKLAQDKNGQALHQVTRAVGQYPDGWPEFEEKPPSWWRPTASDGMVEMSAWLLESLEWSSSLGECWVYDGPSHTLWIWSWKRQYWSSDPNRNFFPDILPDPSSGTEKVSGTFEGN